VIQASAQRGTGSASVASQRLALVVLGATILALSGFLAWEVPRISRVTAAHTDFIETVYGLRAFEAGHDPYGDAVAAQVDRLMVGHPLPLPPGGHYEHPFLYVLPPALVYLPATWLPDEAAIIAVRAVTVALYLVALILLIWRFAGALPAAVRGGLLLIALAWWPFLAVILPIVQQAGTVFAVVVLAALAAERGRWFWAGIACFIALLKPTESAPIVALLALWALRTPAATRPFLAGLLAVGLPASAAAFIVRPTWPLDWVRVLGALRAGHFDYNIDLVSTTATAMHVPVALAWAVAVVVALAWALFAWRAAGIAGHSPASGGRQLWWWVGLTCVLTLLVIPRTGAYDIVITLIPWCVVLREAATQPPRIRRWTIATLILLLLGAGLLAYHDHAAIELPVISLALLGALWICRRAVIGSALRSPPVPAVTTSG
jgi:hypothetical protein